MKKSSLSWSGVMVTPSRTALKLAMLYATSPRTLSVPPFMLNSATDTSGADSQPDIPPQTRPALKLPFVMFTVATAPAESPTR